MRGVLQILRCGSMLLLMAAGVSACESLTRVDNRGYMNPGDAPVAERITIGSSSKTDVQRLLGSPSTISSYPPETWYYISRETETTAFFAPELVGQDVAEITFDEYGYVATLNGYGLEDVQQLHYVERKTPTEGRSLGFFEQLLGNVGRFNTPRDASQARQ